MDSKKEVINDSIGRVEISIFENQVLFNLHDVCKLFNLKYQESRTKLRDGVYEIPMFKDKRKSVKPFIEFKNVELLARQSTEFEIDDVISWLNTIAETYSVSFNGVTINDFKDDEVCKKVLNELKQIRLTCAVLESKCQELGDKAMFVDAIFGKTQRADMFATVCKNLKYKGVSENEILEGLRSAGVFDSNNTPCQKYIDENYFRLAESKVIVKSEETIRVLIMVYQKGIRLIEKMIERKAGIKDGRKRSC